jgi:hypothetical protein
MMKKRKGEDEERAERGNRQNKRRKMNGGFIGKAEEG